MPLNKVILISDSFCFGVSYDQRRFPHDPFWRNMANLAPWLDTRDYGPRHPFFKENLDRSSELHHWQDANRKKIGFMRDECGGNMLISSVVALKPKVCVYMHSDVRFCM